MSAADAAAETVTLRHLAVAGVGELVRGCVTGIMSELRTCQTLLRLFFPALLCVLGCIVF